MIAHDICSLPGCTRVRVMFCFECDRWFCRQHLTQMALVVVPARWETLVCPSCLEEHLYAPRRMRNLLREAVGRDVWDPGLEHSDAFGL